MTLTRGRFGLQAYARILAAVDLRPASPRDVAAALNLGEQSVREVLWGMAKLGLTHVAAWAPKQVPRSSLMVPMFVAGEGQSAPYPVAIKRSAGGATGGNRPELLHFATIVRELRLGATRAEIIERCGTMHHNLVPLLRTMRDLGLARVGAWQLREGGAGRPSEVWVLGTGPDARRPAPVSSKVKQERYRIRRRARVATLHVIHAVAGTVTPPRYGVQSYHLLGKAA